MDTAATLAFFQNFYSDTPFYVVGEAAATPVPGPEAIVPVAPGKAPVPVAHPVAAATPEVAAAAAPPPTPTLAGKLPSLSTLPPMPPVAVAAPVPAGATPAPAVPSAPVPASTPGAAPPRQPAALTVAQLPAAAAAPAGRVQPTPTQSPVAHIPFSTLGSNPKGLVILVRLPAEEFRKLPRNVFLNNLLKAIRLIVEDVVLVNVEHPSYPVALCSLRQHLAARQFLAFGKNLLDVAVYTTQPYEPVLLFGDTAFLGASEISMLEYDAGRKKQLWQAVQRMFMA